MIQRVKRVEEARRQRIEEAKRKLEGEARRKREEEAKRKHEEARQKREQEAQRRREDQESERFLQQLIAEQGWQTCTKCGRSDELTYRCNHMMYVTYQTEF